MIDGGCRAGRRKTGCICPILRLASHSGRRYKTAFLPHPVFIDAAQRTAYIENIHQKGEVYSVSFSYTNST